MSVTASREPSYRGNKIMEGDMKDMDTHYTHTDTHTHLQIHFDNTHQQLPDFRSNPALCVYCEFNMILNESVKFL